ncbi:uncharacterized protein UBRO2_01648 [Ustilago bromivora]|uniref:HNH nuclease domain-containing protein n=1 Tax=Ustilago bromivora TaxID=307758 RepID=A0A8H8TPP5_9BASI|nr:uncharacterized protein UBRO2_01648 [Ustilago bromivora]
MVSATSIPKTSGSSRRRSTSSRAKRTITRSSLLENSPNPDPERILVDHADGDCTNDTAGNLHWVTPSFNFYSKERTVGSGGFSGVTRHCRKFTVHAMPQGHGV